MIEDAAAAFVKAFGVQPRTSFGSNVQRPFRTNASIAFRGIRRRLPTRSDASCFVAIKLSIALRLSDSNLAVSAFETSRLSRIGLPTSRNASARSSVIPPEGAVKSQNSQKTWLTWNR
jgi:hypothetical protein